MSQPMIKAKISVKAGIRILCMLIVIFGLIGKIVGIDDGKMI